ncbi:MAG: hypothetical protein ACRD09_10740 [Vicinamibacterales bacterium]
MTWAELQSLALGLLQGLGVSTVFLLVLFIGFCVVLGFPKLRPGGRKSRVVRSLDEMVDGQPTRYLPPDSPRGPVDQLHTPELAEAAARKSR